jgi:hypothetical protein
LGRFFAMKDRISDETRIKQGRGTGDKEKYKPFKKVRDFSSLGRTHRPKGQIIKRHYELFSDLEYYVFSHLDFDDDVADIKEQKDLLLDDTLNIAKSLHIEHTRSDSNKYSIMTTDFLVIKNDGTSFAISVKPSTELADKRVLEKLEIERVYWNSKKVEWVLITEKDINEVVTRNLLELREAYRGPLKHFDAFRSEIMNLNWNSDTPISELISTASKKCKITFGDGRRILNHLAARKQIRFDYSKPFEINLPSYAFQICK